MTSEEASSISVGVLGGEVSDGDGDVMDIMDLGEEAGESQTLMIGDEFSLLSGSSSLMPGLGIFDDNDNISRSNFTTVHCVSEKRGW